MIEVQFYRWNNEFYLPLLFGLFHDGTHPVLVQNLLRCLSFSNRLQLYFLYLTSITLRKTELGEKEKRGKKYNPKPLDNEYKLGKQESYFTIIEIHHIGMYQYLSPNVHIPLTPAISHFIPFFSIKISCIILLCELFHLFYYRRCACKAKQIDWNEKDQQWIYRMHELFTNLLGPDSCEYEYTEKKHCVVVPGQFSQIQC